MTGWIAFWLALALLFAAGEAIGRNLRIAPFAMAAIAAGGTAWGGGEVGLQWTVYAVAASLLSISAHVAARRLRL